MSERKCADVGIDGRVPPRMNKTSRLVNTLEGGHASERTSQGWRTSAAAKGSIGNFGLKTEEGCFCFSLVVRRDEEAMRRDEWTEGERA